VLAILSRGLDAIEVVDVEPAQLLLRVAPAVQVKQEAKQIA
jgi:hypothetical protein